MEKDSGLTICGSSFPEGLLGIIPLRRIILSFKCDECDFEFNTEKGLSIHKGKKDGNKSTCDICDKAFDYYREIKIHRYTHSYDSTLFVQEQVFKKCEFKFQIAESMEVHLGKCGPDLFCGFCETNFDDLEMLDMHLKTCEIYECSVCSERFLILSEMKKHMHENHESCNKIYHLKIDRKYPNEVNVKKYSLSQL